jgi:hypothetical protein
VPSARRKRSAGALSLAQLGSIGPNARGEPREHLARETTRSARQLRRAADVHVLDEAQLGAALAREVEQAGSSSSLTPRSRRCRA